MPNPFLPFQQVVLRRSSDDASMYWGFVTSVPNSLLPATNVAWMTPGRAIQSGSTFHMMSLQLVSGLVWAGAGPPVQTDVNRWTRVTAAKGSPIVVGADSSALQGSVAGVVVGACGLAKCSPLGVIGAARAHTIIQSRRGRLYCVETSRLLS